MSDIISRATMSSVVDNLAYFSYVQMNSTAALDACEGECESIFRGAARQAMTMSDKTTVLKVLLPLGLFVGIVIALILRARTRTRAASSKGGKDRGLLDLPVDPVVESRSIDLPIDPVKSRSVITAETNSDTDSVSDFEDELTAESPTRPIKESSREVVEEDLVMEDADETGADAGEANKAGAASTTDKSREIAEAIVTTSTCRGIADGTNKFGIPTTDARRKVETNETEVLSTTDKSRETAEAIVATSACRRLAEEEAIANKPAAAEGEAKTRTFQVVRKKEDVAVEEAGKGAVQQQDDAKKQLRAFLAKTDSERLESLRSANIRSIDDLRRSKLDDLSKIVPRQVARRLFSYATAIPKTVWSSMPSLWPRMQGTSPRRLCTSS